MILQIVELIIQSSVASIRHRRPTSGCSRIATAPFFEHLLLAKWVYNVTDRARPQSAEPQAFGIKFRGIFIMEKAVEQLELIIEQGNHFTYENFSSKGAYGYPASYTPEWVAWMTRCKSIILRLFGESSPQSNAMTTALNVKLLGNDHDKFDQCKSYILGTLTAAIDTIKNDVFGELNTKKAKAPGLLSNKVFVVHGHDEKAKQSLEIFLSEIGLEPIVLHRKADEGQTVIEKFEKHSDVGFAFILLTPDEVAYLSTENALPDDKRNKEFRARPNVIFEFGYFIGRLGRSRVCCLHTGGVTLPSDIAGMIYKSYSKNVEEAAYSIIKDLKACGYNLK
jgi:predicted nucleotide-binding protein